MYLKFIAVLYAFTSFTCFSQSAPHQIFASVQSVLPDRNVKPDQTFSLEILIKLGINDSIKTGDVLELFGKIDGYTVNLTRLLALKKLGPDTSVTILISGSIEDWPQFIEYLPSKSIYNGYEHIYIDDVKNIYRLTPYFKLASHTEILSYHGLNTMRCTISGIKDTAAFAAKKLIKYYVHSDTIDLNNCLNYISNGFRTIAYLEVDYYSLSGEISIKVKGLGGQQPWTLSDRSGRIISSGNIMVARDCSMNMGIETLAPGRYTLTVGEGSDELTDYFTVL